MPDVPVIPDAHHNMVASFVELATATEYLRTVFEVVPLGIAIALDAQGADIRGNRTLAEQLGVSADDNISKTRRDGRTPPYRVFVNGLEIDGDDLPLQHAMKARRRENGEFVIRRHDGSEIIVAASAAPLFDASGELRGGVYASLDVTAQRRAEAAERQQRERLAAVLERVTEGVVVFDSDLRLRHANRAACEAAGRSLEELVGGHISELLAEGHETFSSAYQSVIDTGEIRHFEGYSAHFRAWFDVSAYPHEGGVAVFFRDITEQHNAVEALRESEKAADAANVAKDAFLSSLSHELRTPLTVILGWAQAISMLRDREELEQAATAIEQAARAQARLVEDLMDVARISAGKMKLEPEVAQLDDIIRSTVGMLQPQAEHKGVRVNVLSEPVRVVADRGRMQQVIWNLLSNSLKFTPPGGAISVSSGPDNGSAEMVLSDTGDGIDPEFIGSIFDAFAQERESRQYGGLGLGLAIVKHIVEAHGGSVTASSEGRGKGATFRVRLPLA